MKKYFFLILITPILFTASFSQIIKKKSISFENLEATLNPYLKDDGTAIKIIDDEITDTTALFELWVSENSSSDFYYNTLVANDDEIEITLIDETDSNTHIDTIATCTSDVGIPLSYYMFEIDGLETNHTYELYSLNNTGLAVGNTNNPQDPEIIVYDELNVTDNKFTPGEDPTPTEENPYIVNGGFEITSATISSVQFEINVINNQTNDFDPTKSLEVTINDTKGISYQTTATYIEESGANNYIYEITELEDSSNKPFEKDNTYEIYSLNNTGLAVADANSELDDQILINEELGSNGSFVALDDNEGNPYIVSTNGFKIIDTTTNSVEFQITAINNEENSFNKNDPIDVTINDSHGEPHETTAYYVSTNNTNNFVYEITELEDGVDFVADSSYEIYSLNNTGLAVGNGNASIDDEILINEELGATGSFTTIDENDSDSDWDGEWWLLAFIIFLIIMVIIGIILLLQLLDDRRWKKEFDEIEEELGHSNTSNK